MTDLEATLCVWEDCDQDAIYCPGHAEEFAQERFAALAARLAEAERLLREACDWREPWESHTGEGHSDLAKQVAAFLRAADSAPAIVGRWWCAKHQQFDCRDCAGSSADDGG